MSRRLIRRERSIEAACVRYAVSKGCLAWKLTPPPQGIPDRLFILPDGQFCLVEFKSAVGRMSKAQERMQTTLFARGVSMWICRDPAWFKQWLDGLLGLR